MQRVTRATAVASLPAPPAGGTPGFFAAPNPGASVPATVPGYEWFNGVQEELMAVIEGAGLSGSATDHTKLRQALQSMITGAQKAVILNNATFEASVSNGEVVRWDSGNNRFDEAIADGTANNRAVGIADVTNSKVYLYGECPLFSGLTPGARYYLDATTPGAIAATAPADGMTVGIAKSATVLFVDIDALGVRADQRNIWTSGGHASEKALPATTGTVTLDLAAGINFGGTLTGNITLANPSNMAAGQSGVIRIVNNATPRTIAYGSYWKAPGGAMPALTAVAGAVDVFGYYVESASRITLVAQQDSK